MKTNHIGASLLTVASLIGFAGCQSKSTSTSANPVADLVDDHGHEHAEGEEHASHGGHNAGPHGGTVADWGGGRFHVEFTVDHDKQEGTVYILGTDEKTPAPIGSTEIEMTITDPVMQVTLTAAPQENDPAGQASRFIGSHENFAVVQEFAGTISGVIDGTPYSGDFKEVPHGDHDH